MPRTISIGRQSFAELRVRGGFYVDKTGFVCDWWHADDDVTLICRPRRFGKTLMLSTVESFLSTAYAGRGEELFEGLVVWDDLSLRAVQGTVPVISLSFAQAKPSCLDEALASLKLTLRNAVRAHDYLRGSSALTADDLAFLGRVSDGMDNVTAARCLGELCAMLERHWGTKPVVLLDEYDAPMQEAWLHGYWDDLSSFMRSLFNATFKTNASLGRALVTGITRVASESIFSDLNNLSVVTATVPQYQTAFGFTEDEVARALDEYGMPDALDDVRRWYDGFTFGGVTGIYNPWSITSFLQWHELRPYWANTSTNGLVSLLVRAGDATLKSDFEILLSGAPLPKELDEQVAFQQLESDSDAVWSLLLAAGYVRADEARPNERGLMSCMLRITNHEVAVSLEKLVSTWFASERQAYNEFVQALLAGDATSMEDYLTDLADGVMSSFDTGGRPSRSHPERFWHGLALGLLVELRGRYEVRSNPESGRGRCDILLVPIREEADPAVVIEFKVFDERRGEKDLADTVDSALSQIEERRYVTNLRERGIGTGRIRCYGIAFRGKEVRVGSRAVDPS